MPADTDVCDGQLSDDNIGFSDNIESLSWLELNVFPQGKSK